MTLVFPHTAATIMPSPSLAALPLRGRAEGILITAIGLQLGLAAPSLIALFADERLINGISVWIKPLKFQTSLVLMLATLLVLLPLIEARTRAGRGVFLACLAAALTATAEIAYITLQAARGRASHFNTQTATEALAYAIMGVGATILVLSSFAIGIFILRRPAFGTTSGNGAGLRLGAGWGLILGSVMTLVTAFVLASGEIDGPDHWVGGLRTDVGGLPLLGWSRSGGDLRVPHFFATHIMQALPLLGLCLDRLMPSQARTGIAVGAALSIAIVAATFVQAVLGRPFL